MSIKNKICLGVIADDFTGAGDAASFLVKSGMNTTLYTRIPDSIPEMCDCIVIALKSRSVEPMEAILQTEEALKFLKKADVEHYYFKYCSTFDSTPSGNIGVVLDYLMDELEIPYTILCPSLPVNGRTVKNGILYVNGVELSKSPMKNHPLNPMWDSYIPKLMKEQSRYPCFVISKKDKQEKEIHDIIQNYKHNHQKFYLIPDYETDEDAKLISNTFSNLSLMSGGSGLLEHVFHKKSKPKQTLEKKAYQKAIILCGSCSKMTRKQIHKYCMQGGITYPVDSKKLLNESINAYDIFAYITKQSSPVLIYSDAVDKNISELSQSDNFLLESKLMERLMADLSKMAYENGFDKIIVAGGETSGAVAMALGYDAYQIGGSIAPGVPMLLPLENKKLSLVLKSGNFGDEDFFKKAIGMEECKWNKK